MKRIVSLLIAVIMVLSMIPPLGVYGAEPVTVYMDPVNGSNENSGTEASPVQDFATAYSLLQEGGGTIVLLDTVAYTSSVILPACDYPVTITSATGAEGISSTHHITVAGDTTFENMTFTHTRASSTTTIRGGGHKLTMGEGLTVVPCVSGNTSYYFCLEGGFYSGEDVESTELTVKSGQYRYIYAGSYGTNVTGNAKLTMTGGTASWVAACRTGSISGNVEMTFSGTANITGMIYGGSASSGSVGGNSTITLGQGAGLTNLCVGSNGTGNITGTATVICDGFDGTFTSLAGTGGSTCTGTIGASRLVLNSGTLSKAPTDFGTVDIEIPEGKTLTLACDLSADTLASSGTMNFSGVASLTAAAVTGSVACTIEGEALKNHIYVTAPAGSDITFPAETGVVEQSGTWVNHDLEEFAGLVLQTDSNNSLTLYTGLWRSGDDTEHVEVTPYATETVDGMTYRYYSNLQGNYYVRSTRSGYIGVYQNIYMSAEEAATKTVETVTLEKKGTGGYVPANVYINTDEVMENEAAWKSEISMFPEEYTKYLQNPVFQEGRDAHRMTTGEELEEELTALDKPDDNMYRYSVGESLKGRDIPLVIFTETDLSGAATLEEAAAALDNSDKLTVYYRAQMHGNEPAGGEGALAMLYKLQDGYAEELLDKINLIVVPRLNPDGSYNYLRRLADSDETDPNRDQLHLKSKEMQEFQKSYLLFDPEVVIDGHERMWNNPWGDMQISASFTPMNSDEYRAVALELDQAAFQSLEAAGLNGYYYAGIVNTLESTLGGGYYPLAGSMYILQESRGIHESDEAMERRVVGQLASATGLLNYLHENAEKVKAVVIAERASVAQKGATYSEDDLFVLDTDNRKTTAADAEAWGNLNIIGQTIDWATGEVTFPVRYPTVDDEVVRARPAPTAYVIPANLANIDSILSLIEMHGISYSYLPEGATLPLQRYAGDTTIATLDAEANVRFGQGCYVFTMNHSKGQLLATLMEPDNINTQHEKATGNIAQIGLLSVSDTYRYIRDLNAQGTVDYTVTAANYVDITVWLDGTNGADTNDGLSEATAVKTLEQAYTILAAAMEGASSDSQANLKIVGLYELGAARVSLPSANFHVTISGKTADDGFSYTPTSKYIVDINGDTTFQNMKLHLDSTTNYNYLACNGHKVVFGEGMNCTTDVTNRYFTLAGGAYSTTVASTDLTVRSGNWRTIYVGGYLGSVTGQAKADVSGCWIYQNIVPSYRGSAGSVDIKVANTTVSDLHANSAIYAGITDSKDVDIAGDVTITLGDNVIAQAVYASSRASGDIHGTVTVIADGVDLSQVPVYAECPGTTGTTAMAILQINEGSITQAAATFATGSNAYIRLGADTSEDITLATNTYLDLDGKDITGSVTGEGTLLGFDSANDTYDAASCGTVVSCDVQTVVDAPNGNRYVAVTDSNGTSFHRLDMKITAVSLRTTTGGMYYWADWDCDSTLAANIKNYGIACKRDSAPDAAALSDEIAEVTDGAVLYSWMTNSAEGDGIFADADTDDEITGAIMNGIISDEEIEGYTNAQRGEMPIYAEPYVILKNDEVVVAAGGVNYSLYTACQAIDDMITGMEELQTKTDYIAYMESLFADVWNKYGLGWTFTNFSKAS